MKFKVRSIALLAVLAIAAVFPVSASASIGYTATSQCFSIINDDSYPRPIVCFGENYQDTYGSDKYFSTTGSDAPNLDYQTHWLAGTCYAPIKIQDDWNDCLSFVAFEAPNATNQYWYLCIYEHTNYNASGNWVRLTDTSDSVYTSSPLSAYDLNDKVSSFKVIYSTVTGGPSCTNQS